MHTQTNLSTQAEHNASQEKALTKRLFDFCVDAATKTQVTTESKDETPALKPALDLINQLDSIIATLHPAFQLSKRNIINAAIYPEEDKAPYKKISHYVIASRLNTLLPHLIKHGLDLSDESSLHVCVNEVNHYAFKLFFENQPKNIPSLLVSTLASTATHPQKEQEQLMIVDDLLPRQSSDSLKGPLEVAATKLVSVTLVSKILNRTPVRSACDEPIPIRIITTLLKQTTEQTQETLSKIILLLLNHFIYTDADLKKIQITAATTCSTIIDQRILTTLKRLGTPDLTPAELNEAFQTTLREANGCADNNIKQVQKQLAALHAAGANINGDPIRGSENLLFAINTTQPTLLVTLLSLSYYFPEQLNRGLIAFIQLKSIVFSNASLLIQYGASLHAQDENGIPFLNMLLRLFVEINLRYPEQASLLIKPLLSFIKMGIDASSKKELDKAIFSFFSLSKESMKTPLFAPVVEELILAGADISQMNFSNQTFLFLLVYNGSAQAASYVCQALRLTHKLDVDYQGEFYRSTYYRSPFIDTDRFCNRANFTSERELVILAQGDTAVTDVLLAENFPITFATYVYKDFSNSNAQYTAIYEKLNAHIPNKFKPTPSRAIADKLSLSVVLNEEKAVVGTEMLSLNHNVYDAVSIVTTLTTKELITMKMQEILKLLNSLLAHDINTSVNKASVEFELTTNFLEELRKTRFDYITILTTKESFPLLTLLKNVTEDKQDYYRYAIWLLLSYAPYSQIQKLKTLDDEFNVVKKRLPKNTLTIIKQEIDKQRADLPDLCFYLNTRAKDPDERFYQRVITYQMMLNYLRNHPNSFLQAINLVIGKTRVLGFPGQTTRVLLAMQNDITCTHNKVKRPYIDRLRFSCMSDLNDPFILHSEKRMIDSALNFGRNYPDVKKEAEEKGSSVEAYKASW